MRITKSLEFDFYLVKMKEQTQPKIFDAIAQRISAHCETDHDTLKSVFTKRLSERTFGMGEGVSIFDVKSVQIKKPLTLMATFEHDVDFNALDNKPVNVMAAVISPQTLGPFHLQRLAVVSRVLRSKELCNALRDAKNEDAMRVLFMPTQDWMIAA